MAAEPDAAEKGIAEASAHERAEGEADAARPREPQSGGTVRRTGVTCR
jgi:hypothetical protein